MYPYTYNTYGGMTSSAAGSGVWSIISIVVAIIGGIVAYILFVAKPKKAEYKGFVAWLHEFLNFKTLFLSTILKVTYIITTIFITLISFNFISSSAIAFFGMLILGNLIARVSYEFLMLTITLVNNTTEINNKLSKKKEDSDK